MKKYLTLIILLQLCLITSCNSSLLQEGFSQFQKRDYDNAIESFDKLISKEPENKIAHYYRGYCYDDTGQTDKALKDYSKAIDLDAATNNFYGPYFNRGILFLKKALYEKALLDFNSAINILNKNEKTVSKSKMLSRDRELVYEARIDTNYNLDAYDKVIEDCETMIKYYPDSFYAYNNYAFILSGCPVQKYLNGEKAVSLAKTALDIITNKKLEDEVRSVVLSTLASAYARVGEYNKAVKFQEESISLSNKDIEMRKEILNIYKDNKPWSFTTHTPP